VLTGGLGRIDRARAVEAGDAKRLPVDQRWRRARGKAPRIAAEYVARKNCSIAVNARFFEAEMRSNATEVSDSAARRNYKSACG
jgi:hypothetical protein